MAQLAQYTKRTLYILKRKYGSALTLYKINTETLDLETGKRTPSISYIKIKKAVLLPSKLQRAFEYDRAYTSAHPNFTYGGFYDTSLRQILIDLNDLKRIDGITFIPEEGDYFTFNQKRWEVAQVHDYQASYLIIGKEVKGAPRCMIEDGKIESNLQLTQEIGVA